MLAVTVPGLVISSANVSVGERLKALVVVSVAGKKPPPRFEAKPPTKDDMVVFIKEDDKYHCGQMGWGESGEVPQNPAEVLELLGWSQRPVTKGVETE